MPKKKRSRVKIVVQCKNCQNPRGDYHKRSLCFSCYNKQHVRLLYPTIGEASNKVTNQQVPVTDVYQRIIAAWSNHPLWQPAEFPRDDPRFNELVEARRAAKLPAIHPDDPKPNLE